MPAKSKAAAPRDPTATIGFEVSAVRGSANPQCTALLRTPQGSRWLTAGTFRSGLIKADLTDCMAALPGQLCYSTQIHGCLWPQPKSKSTDAKLGFRACRKQTLFRGASAGNGLAATLTRFSCN